MRSSALLTLLAPLAARADVPAMPLNRLLPITFVTPDYQPGLAVLLLVAGAFGAWALHRRFGPK